MGVSKNRGGSPKMDGENHGKPYEQMADLEFSHIFGNTQINLQNIINPRGWWKPEIPNTHEGRQGRQKYAGRKQDQPTCLLILDRWQRISLRHALYILEGWNKMIHPPTPWIIYTPDV